MAFTVGNWFASYADLESKVKDYESANNVQLTHRDSRTLESAQKRVPKRVEGANSSLKYYFVYLTCVCGGKPYKSRIKGDRPNQR